MNGNKQIYINMLAQMSGFLINGGINFFLTPFIVKNIGVSAYGFVGLANDFIGYIQLATIALNSMAARFITIEICNENFYKANQYFTSILVANIFMSMFLLVPSVPFILFLDNLLAVPLEIIEDVKILWFLIFLNFFLGIITSIYNVATFAKNRLEIVSVISVGANIIKASVLIFTFLFFEPSLWFIGLAALMSNIFIVNRNVKYTKELLPEIQIKKTYFEFLSIKELVTAGIWNVFIKLSKILFAGLNLLIANLFIGSEAMGIIAVVRIIPNVILSAFAVMAGTFTPQLTISYAKKEFKDIQKQLISSVKILGMFSTIPVAVLFVYGDIFYKLWMPNQNTELLYLLTIIACTEFLIILQLEGLWNIFTVTNKIKIPSLYLFIESIATALTVILLMQIMSSDYYKIFAIVSVSVVFGLVRALICLPIFGAKCLGFGWAFFYRSIWKNIMSLFLVMMVSFIFKRIGIINDWFDLLIAIFITICFSLFINYFMILGKAEREKFIFLILKVIKDKC